MQGITHPMFREITWMVHVIKSPADNSTNLLKWFLDHQMKANSNKCYLITNKQSCMNLKIENINIEKNTCENILQGKVDNKLNFNEPQDGIIEKAIR